MALLRSANWLWLIAINMPLPRSEEMTFARGSLACRLPELASFKSNDIDKTDADKKGGLA
jgi:hypothetical protein